MRILSEVVPVCGAWLKSFVLFVEVAWRRVFISQVKNVPYYEYGGGMIK
jgi:hypothetical protein